MTQRHPVNILLVDDRQENLLALQAILEPLEEALERYRALSSTAARTGVTRALAGASPVRDRAPATAFAELVRRYGECFDGCLEQIIVDAPKPAAEMHGIARALGHLGGGPRDLLDVHVAALEEIVRGATAAKARACAVEGRLMALEMMGMLVDYYRTGGAGVASHEEDET